jgi:DNA-binding NarL/FixJ family response regulator
LVNKHPLVLAALRELLAGPPLLARVSCYRRSDEAIEDLECSRVDLVLSELRAWPFGGQEVATRLAAAGGPPVALLVDPEDAERVKHAPEPGSGGVLTADVTPEEFIAGVDAMLRGHYVMSSNLARRRLGERGAGEQRVPALEAYRSLSPSEREILHLLGQANSIDSIAAKPGVAKKTVRNHVASIYRKLELKSRADAILWVARAGLDEAPAVAAQLTNRALA